MNKKKMGNFLLQLRKEKKFTQTRLSNEFLQKYYLEVSENAISSWENGESIPDLDKLNILSDIFKVSVDELLDGQRYEPVNYKEKYHINDIEFLNTALFVKRLGNDCVTTMLTNEAKSIRELFKKYVFDFIDDSISRSDYQEMIYFIKNFYLLSEDMNITSYLQYLKTLRNSKLSKEELWWEAQKYVFPLKDIRVSFGDLGDEGYNNQNVLSLWSITEDWEKDMILSCLQFSDPVFYDPSVGSSKTLAAYEKEKNKPFNRDQITKDTIRFLIKSGAVINKNFLSFQEGRAETKRVIDLVEENYNRLHKPFEVCVQDNGEYRFYYVENTIRNRLYLKYEYQIIRPLTNLGYSYDDIYKMILKNEHVPDDIYLKAAQDKGIDINRDIEYVKADARIHTDVFSLEHYWEKYRNEELENQSSVLDDLERFTDELKNNIKEYTHVSFHWIGGQNFHEKCDYVFQKKMSISYKEFISGRMINKTKELLKSLDTMDMNDIRRKFFQLGGVDND